MIQLFFRCHWLIPSYQCKHRQGARLKTLYLHSISFPSRQHNICQLSTGFQHLSLAIIKYFNSSQLISSQSLPIPSKLWQSQPKYQLLADIATGPAAEKAAASVLPCRWHHPICDRVWIIPDLYQIQWKLWCPCHYLDVSLDVNTFPWCMQMELILSLWFKQMEYYQGYQYCNSW